MSAAKIRALHNQVTKSLKPHEQLELVRLIRDSIRQEREPVQINTDDIALNASLLHEHMRRIELAHWQEADGVKRAGELARVGCKVDARWAAMQLRGEGITIGKEQVRAAGADAIEQLTAWGCFDTRDDARAALLERFTAYTQRAPMGQDRLTTLGHAWISLVVEARLQAKG